MQLSPPPTIETFYKFCAERKLMGLRCRKCKTLLVPPRNICFRCLHDQFEWVPLSGSGNLLTYTIIYFPPTQFHALAPYAVGIARLVEGPQLPGMIKHVKPEDLKINMKVETEFETSVPKEWPQWPRYYFRPA